MHQNSKKILILGASGYVGKHLYRHFGIKAIGTYNSTPLPNAVQFTFPSSRIAEIVGNGDNVSHGIILIGETHIDTCANDRKRSRAINVEGIIELVTDLVHLGIKPVFVSTDNVFDGTSGNYNETDKPEPIVTYGQQKYEVEKFIQEHCREYCIVRLSKVFGLKPGDGTLFSQWHDQLCRGQQIRVADDQIITPVWIGDLVEGFSRLVSSDLNGLYHLCGTESLNRSALLNKLTDIMGPGLKLKPNVVELGINDFGLAERRPLNVSMNSTKIQKDTGMVFHTLSELLLKMLDTPYKNDNHPTLPMTEYN